ncbi:hypothetical protein RP75_21000 [Agrobacterium arsenijevicii]|uniref:Porin n=1 Tax=Agrobacterium arsenijevicii TaxID=1585697 RepID=A0ABR5D2W5_9HYPH|nr:hypothetical protein RP75_21000 [Agrobacterium arsenijevicii]
MAIASVYEADHSIDNIRFSGTSTTNDLELNDEVGRAKKTPFDIRTPNNDALAVGGQIETAKFGKKFPIEGLEAGF